VAQRGVALLRYLQANHPRLLLLAKVAFVFVLFFIVCYGRLDPDFGWALHAGNYFRAHGIPTHDIFTYTARNFRWIDHEWGSDVLISYLYQHGYLVVSLFFAGLWTLGLMINAWRVRFIFLLMALAAMLPYADIRPTVLTVVGLAIILRLLTAKNVSKTIFWLPLLFLLWANLHGGFVLGLAILLYFAVIRKSKPLLLMFLLCVPITFINPYGPRLYVEIFRTLTDLSLHFQTDGMAIVALQYSVLPLIVLWGAGFWLFGRQKLINWIGVGPLLLLASLAATRNVPLFTVAATPELNNYFTQTKSLFPEHPTKEAQRLYTGLALAVVGITIFFIVGFAIPSANRDAGYPVSAAAYLKAHPCSGNLFNDFNYGGYLIWQLPSQPVYIDGRMPSWRNSAGQKYIDIYDQVISNQTTRQKQFSKYHISCVLLSKSSFNNQLLDSLQKSGWKTAIQTGGSELLLKP
jgi:hypothetical protein